MCGDKIVGKIVEFLENEGHMIQGLYRRTEQPILVDFAELPWLIQLDVLPLQCVNVLSHSQILHFGQVSH